MNYHFGFSLRGFIIFLLPMIPNIFYFLIPAADASGKNVNSHLILDIFEHGSQAVFFFLLIFVIRIETFEILSPYTIGMAIMLILYYILWIFYFTGKVNLVILLGMAILPVVYFILGEMWLHIYIAVIPTVLFGIVHVIITYMDFSIK